MKDLNIEKIENILNEFDEKKILVVGDIMLDEYIFGNVSRISPEAPVQVLNVEKESYVLGGAANVVNNLVALGSKVYAAGLIGKDENSKKILKEFEIKKVNSDLIVKDLKKPTTVKKRIIAQHQQLLRIDWEDTKKTSSSITDKIFDKIKKNINKFDAIILSDYDKGLLTFEFTQNIIKLASKNKKIVLIDPKPSNKSNYKGATSMTPNTKEALEILGMKGIDNEKDFIDLGKQIKAQLKLKNLLITRSEHGMSIFENNEVINIPTYAKDVFDVTGAGDTVISVYTLALICGASNTQAAKLANVAAGIVVGHVGTATVTKDDILNYIKSHMEKSNV